MEHLASSSHMGMYKKTNHVPVIVTRRGSNLRQIGGDESGGYSNQERHNILINREYADKTSLPEHPSSFK